jgi:hypothetical protein
VPGSTTNNASRVLMAIGSVQALLALGLPFALETSRTPTVNEEKLLGGTEVWSGWSLARASHTDGHVPVPQGWVIVLVVATIGLVVLAWLALERPGAGWPAAAAGLGAALLVSSMLIGNAVVGTFGDDHQGTSAWGLPIWRVALLLVVVAGLLACRPARAPRPDQLEAGWIAKPHKADPRLPPEPWRPA